MIKIDKEYMPWEQRLREFAQKFKADLLRIKKSDRSLILSTSVWKRPGDDFELTAVLSQLNAMLKKSDPFGDFKKYLDLKKNRASSIASNPTEPNKFEFNNILAKAKVTKKEKWVSLTTNLKESDAKKFKELLTLQGTTPGKFFYAIAMEVLESNSNKG
ncbi:MAG: hypothetical protein LBF00_03105 [Mycoplasmataceae bacterium]|jgi:hypothetical protein|nr:hypothetical protein [Mycoplasmataceae bacterium]